MPIIKVDVEMDEFDYEDICDEFQSRINKTLTPKQTEYISDVIDDVKELFLSENEKKCLEYFKIKSMEDELKFELLSKAFVELSLTELEDKLK